MKNILLLTLGLISFGVFAQNDSLNMTKLSGWTSPSASFYNDIWGYADTNGREYAILGSNWGTHFVDITNPNSPVLVDEFAGNHTNVTWRDFKTNGAFAYGVADGASNSLQIFDLSNLPASVTKVYDQTTWTTSAHNIFIDNDRAYLLGNSRGGNSYPMDILSISIPNSPSLIGTLDNTFFGNCSWGCLHDAYVKDDTAYCSAGPTGLYIYDLTNVVSPTLISSITTYSEQGYNHAAWVNEDYQTMVMADETHGSGVKSFDMTDITTPTEIDVFRTVAGAIPHNPFIRGTEAVISYYHDGMQIFDISDPANVTQKAFYDTYPDNAPGNHSGYEGDWGVYPFLPSGNIIASDISYGLFVLGKVNDAYTTNTEMTVCITDTIAIDYTAVGVFNNGNDFILEMADTSSGHFVTPTLISQQAGTASGTIYTQLPQSLPTGSYRLRIRSTSPAVVQGDWMTVTVEYPPTIPTVTENTGVLTSSSASTYQWYLDGNPISGAISQNYTPAASGDYQVEITEGACSSISTAFTFTMPSGIAELKETIRIYPNPSTGKFNLANPSGSKLVLKIHNAIGQQVLHDIMNQKAKTYELKQGMYFVKIRSTQGEFVEKLIIK